jgi:ribosomal protein S12 methylthiotransferase
MVGKQQRYWLQTLGCPKNRVDSDKLTGVLVADGYAAAASPDKADLVVLNTCAFIEEARQESIEAILELDQQRRPGARLVVTGCLAERYGDELAAALPEVDLVAGFGVSPTVGGHPVSVTLRGAAVRPSQSFDLLELPRPAAQAPWAYLKAAEGCDRACGFCAIPSFRGPQRSRRLDDLVAEAKLLASGPNGAKEIVVVAQDLASYGRDRSTRRIRRLEGDAQSGIVELVDALRGVTDRIRLLYIYPSSLTDRLVDAVLETGVPYFDLSLQHVSRPLLARMRRWGDGERFLDRIARIRDREPDATFRSSFIVGYPGETEEDHDSLLEFLAEARLDWAGFFPFSMEEGTMAATLSDQVGRDVAMERLREASELQDRITAERRDRLVGRRLSVLVDRPGIGRSVHEAPEIDGVVRLPAGLEVGSVVDLEIVRSLGVDVVGDIPGRGKGYDLDAAVLVS